MDLLSAAILGIVEGLTEFLPVSSTGHLIIASRLMGLPQSEFLKSFEIAIQLGAIAAVAWVCRATLLHDRDALKKIAVGFVPTAVLGVLLHGVVKRYLLSSETVVLWAMGIGGAALIAFETLRPSPAGDEPDVRKVTYRQAAVIGLAQSLAMIPGVSRSAATVVGGLAQGIDRATTVQFSFLLAVPTMLAATGLDLVKSADVFGRDDVAALAVGFVTAFVVALFAVRFLLRFVRTRTFIPFGIYRMVAAVAFWALLAR